MNAHQRRVQRRERMRDPRWTEWFKRMYRRCEGCGRWSTHTLCYGAWDGAPILACTKACWEAVQRRRATFVIPADTLATGDVVTLRFSYTREP